jgi:4-hydroxy-tetrahydrodipicolinate synthase
VPNHALGGIVVPLATPFRDDERIDFGAWQKIIDRMIAAGVDGLMVGGSTGEFYALDAEERMVALRFCLQAAAGRTPIYANVGCITTAATIDLARRAQDLGVDVLVVVTPYYIKPSDPELAEHYKEICRAVRLPVVAYNFPQHGGREISPQMAAEVAAQCENLAGLKDSSGKLEQAIAYRQAVSGREFAVFVGPEHLILPALSNGCAGGVCGCANIAPDLFVDLYRAFQKGELDRAARLQTLASELSAGMGLHTFPSAIKEAMALVGLPAGLCRKPVGPMPPEARAKLAPILRKLESEGYVHQPAGQREKSVPAPTRP